MIKYNKEKRKKHEFKPEEKLAGMVRRYYGTRHHKMSQAIKRRSRTNEVIRGRKDFRHKNMDGIRNI